MELEEVEEGEGLERCCLMGEEWAEGEEVETREVREGRSGVFELWALERKVGAKKEEEKLEEDRRGMKRSV